MRRARKVSEAPLKESYQPTDVQPGGPEAEPPTSGSGVPADTPDEGGTSEHSE